MKVLPLHSPLPCFIASITTNANACKTLHLLLICSADRNSIIKRMIHKISSCPVFITVVDVLIPRASSCNTLFSAARISNQCAAMRIERTWHVQPLCTFTSLLIERQLEEMDAEEKGERFRWCMLRVRTR